MGGLFGIGGSSSKTDRSTTLKGYGALENAFNYALPTGENDTNAASSYNLSVLGGSRSNALQAIAPEASAATAGADASKRQLATSGTARGGGTAAVNEQTGSNTLAQIDQMLFGARSGAAKNLGSIGTNLLSTGAGAASDLTNAAIGSKQQSDANAGALGQGVGDLAAALLFA